MVDEEHADVELPPVDLDLILSDFNWTASADASALEASLIAELQALEAVLLVLYHRLTFMTSFKAKFRLMLLLFISRNRWKSSIKSTVGYRTIPDC